MSKYFVKCHQCASDLVRKTESSMYFCNITCKAVWQKTQRPVSDEWLKDAYTTQGLNCTQIAKIVNRNSKRVWEWLKDIGIETKGRGTTGNHIYSIGVPRVLTEAGRASLSASARAARMRDGRKPYLKDGKHWLHHEGAVSPAWNGGITPERQSFYASQEWKDVVKEVWKRDNCSCVKCGSQLSHKRGHTAIHHVESFKNKLLRADLKNLVLLCKPCHLWIHSKKNINSEYIKDAS